jgi:hypothetical protein
MRSRGLLGIPIGAKILIDTDITVPIGLLQGLVVSRKDDDEVYVSGGSIEVGGVVYNSGERFAVSVDGEPTGYTADLCTGGTASASHYNESYPPSNLFDNNAATYMSIGTAAYPETVQYDIGVDNTIKAARYTMKSKWAGYNPTAWQFRGKLLVGDEWTVLDTQTGQSFGGAELKIFTFAHVAGFRYHDWNLTAGDSELCPAEFEIMEAVYALSVSTPYYIYVDPPTSGTELTTGNLVLSATAPTWDSAKGGWYHPTNTDQRAIARFTTDGDGHVPTQIYPYLSVPLTIAQVQPTPTAETTAVTLTLAKLLTGIITGTHAAGATQAYTLPTGTLCDEGYSVNDSFDWVLINLSAAALDTITITADTDHTIIGNPIVQSAYSSTGGLYGNSAMFRTRKTAAHVFETYRIA